MKELLFNIIHMLLIDLILKFLHYLFFILNNLYYIKLLSFIFMIFQFIFILFILLKNKMLKKKLILNT